VTNYGDDGKRRIRQIKRNLKREGNKNRRRALKQSLEDNPEEAQYDEYEFERDSSTTWNERRDRKRYRRKARDNESGSEGVSSVEPLDTDN